MPVPQALGSVRRLKEVRSLLKRLEKRSIQVGLMETLRGSRASVPISGEGPGKWESLWRSKLEVMEGGQTSRSWADKFRKDSRWGRWLRGAGAPPSFLSPPPPAPPTTIGGPCACARRHRLPNIASSPPPVIPSLATLSSARAHDSLTSSAEPRDPKPLPGPRQRRFSSQRARWGRGRATPEWRT